MSAFGVNILAIGLGGIIIAAFTTAALDVRVCLPRHCSRSPAG